MARTIEGRSDKAGMPPGSLVHVGDTGDKPVIIRIMEYGPGGVQEREVRSAQEARLSAEPTRMVAPTALSEEEQKKGLADQKVLGDLHARVAEAAKRADKARDAALGHAAAQGLAGTTPLKAPVSSPANAGIKKEERTIRWVTVVGLQNPELIAELGEELGVHDLVLENVMDTAQRPKIEDMDDQIFVLMKWLNFHKKEMKLDRQQVSLLACKDMVVTFKQHGEDIFEPLRDRIRHDRGRIRQMGADYLLYAIMDFIVDGYFVAFEGMDEMVDNLEDQLATKPKAGILHTLHHLRRQAIFVRKSIWPLRDMLGTLARNEVGYVTGQTEIYFRTLYDHTIQVIEATESLREALSGLHDLYISSVSSHTNAVMKVLTVIATIFIPLSFIASVYGMNFEQMPGLNSAGGFWIALSIMSAVAIGMIVYFQRRRWV